MKTQYTQSNRCSFWALLTALYWIVATTLPTYAMPAIIDKTEDVKALGYTDNRKLECDSHGHLYVAYRKKYKLFHHTAYHIFVAKSTDGGATWRILNQNRPIEMTGDENQRVPALAIDHQDVIHLVWYGKDAGSNGRDENQIKYVRSTDGGQSWSPWLNLHPIAGYQGQEMWQEHPTIYVDQQNILYIVWEGRDQQYPQAPQTKFSKSVDGGLSWTPWINVSPTASNHSRPTLVTTSRGRLYLFAYSNLSRLQQIVYSTSADGGRTWSAWTPVAPSNQDQRHVSVAIDAEDQLHIVWRQRPLWALAENDIEAQIYYSTSSATQEGNTASAQWSEPIRVGPAIGFLQSFPSITVVDSDRSVWIAWSENREGIDFPQEAPEDGIVYYVVKNQQGWSDRIRLSESRRSVYPSFCRYCAQGGAPVSLIWLENSREQKSMFHTHLGLPKQYFVRPTAPTILSHSSLLQRAFRFTATAQPSFLTNLVDKASMIEVREALTLLLVVVFAILFTTVRFLFIRWLQLLNKERAMRKRTLATP